MLTNVCYLQRFLNSWNDSLRALMVKSLPDSSDGKKSAWSVGDPGSIPGWGRSPGEVNGNPLQDYCLGNSGEIWQATVHGVTKSQTRLSDFISLGSWRNFLQAKCTKWIAVHWIFQHSHPIFSCYFIRILLSKKNLGFLKCIAMKNIIWDHCHDSC